MERFEARASIGGTALLVLGSLAFVVAGLCFVISPDALAGPDGPPWMRGMPGLVIAIGAAAVLFFGLTAMVGLRQFLRRGAVVTIDAAGIRWRRWSDATIPWDAISQVAVTEMMNQRFLSLWLADPAAWPSTSLSGRLAAANRGMGYGDITIAPAGLDRGAEAMWAAVEHFAPARLLGR